MWEDCYEWSYVTTISSVFQVSQEILEHFLRCRYVASVDKLVRENEKATAVCERNRAKLFSL